VIEGDAAHLCQHSRVILTTYLTIGPEVV
jgi:hypothetical protein